ncbi:MAG: RNase J family beta-CASP ribonuclease [Candidatus Moranbacteria bacterium]|nr:RNase J family beta-CASP ribonuclease [Candidatus Moranbacteria bacterium]
MNEISTPSGSVPASGNNGGRRHSGRRHHRPSRPSSDRPVTTGGQPESRERKPVGSDILSSGLKNALSLGSLEGLVARSQAYRDEPKSSAHKGEAPVSGKRPEPQETKQQKSGHRRPMRRPSSGQPAHQDVARPAAAPQGDGKDAAPRKSSRKQGGARRPQFPAKIELATVRKAGNVVADLPPAGKKLRIIPLGGQEEVGRNMAVFEYGDDIVVIDMGVQWPEEDMPGVDYIVPNASYLKGKEKRIRGVIFTHGHLDHIGGAPILLKQLGYPPVIGRDFTLALIKRKLEDHEPGSASRLKTVRIGSLNDRIRLGAIEARFFEVEHSIMDAIGIALLTPSGTVVHMGDWTIANDRIEGEDISYKHLADLPRPTILMLESLGATKKGLPPSEREVHENFQAILANAPGRVIIGTFASQIRRVAYLLEYAERLGKRVALMGYSMKMNVETAKELGYIKTKKETLVPINDIGKYPDNQVVVICTGAQGESNAALARIVTDNDKNVKLKKSDTIVFSSSIIPGNERSIQRLKDNLYRKCDHVIHSDIMDVHIGGHSTAQGIEEMLRQVKPTYFIPVYANHYFLKEAANIAYRIGFPEKNVFVLDNGHVLEFDEKGEAKLHPKKVDSSYIFIDGLGVGDVGNVVLRDRQMLAADGMVVITVVVNGRSKQIVGGIQITSRGFIHVKENFDLVNETKRKVQQVVKQNTSKETSLDWDLLRNQIRDVVGQFLFQKMERRPMILPVVIEV